MANNKVAFSYSNMDTDRFQDIKIKKLKKKFKCDGYAVYDYLVNEIYRVKGCYLEWDSEVLFDVAEYWGLDEERVQSIVDFCLKIELFDEEIFNEHSIITAKSIQSRFIKWSKLLKRTGIKIPEFIDIIQEESDIIQEEYIDYSGSLPTREKREKKREKGERENAHTREVFTPPSFDEVRLFFEDKIPDTFWDFEKCKTEAKGFIEYYERTSWKINGDDITNWKSTASGWIKNDGRFEKEKSEKNLSANGHPNHWSKAYADKLDGPKWSSYVRHLIALGYKPVKDRFDNIISYEKPKS